MGKNLFLKKLPACNRQGIKDKYFRKLPSNHTVRFYQQKKMVSFSKEHLPYE